MMFISGRLSTGVYWTEVLVVQLFCTLTKDVRQQLKLQVSRWGAELEQETAFISPDTNVKSWGAKRSFFFTHAVLGDRRRVPEPELHTAALYPDHVGTLRRVAVVQKRSLQSQ